MNSAFGVPPTSSIVFLSTLHLLAEMSMTAGGSLAVKFSQWRESNLDKLQQVCLCRLSTVRLSAFVISDSTVPLEDMQVEGNRSIQATGERSAGIALLDSKIRCTLTRP